MVLAALGLGMSASAQLNVVFDNVQGGHFQTVTLQSPVIDGGNPVSGVEAGIYYLKVNGVVTPSFCIDVASDAPQTTQIYTKGALSTAPADAAGPMGTTGATKVEQLWAAYFSPSMSSVAAAGLQVAIWEVIASAKGYALTVSGNSAVTSQATADIAGIAGVTPDPNLVALMNSGYQNYVISVPEASTIIACALMALPFGASALRILRRGSAA